ncbi:hypothetical protein F5Y01DRAFT_274963 [Xylaria sp. FL0043]|nr:hypothetical protein F5Y01DRAFT_274963 [Xylaria sp. FL0043]
MDSGSYNNIRRGTMPLSSAGGNATSYKANVNRTKTRKWVEAKVQSYDGDDWGNDYDDEYDDGNDQDDEPEPVPPKTTQPAGPRQPGPIGHQLPSSRTFSQPSTTSSFPSADSRVFGPSALRSPSGPPSLHVQTQPTAPATTSPPYATDSARPAAASSQTNVPSGPYSAGPASTPSRFPPRKSSMGQNDRPDFDSKPVVNPGSRPASSSSNRPWVDQRSASPSLGSAPAAKTFPLVRPADIYKRVEEEKEKERLSMESGRPSLDSIYGRTEGAPPVQFRSPGDQRRRTSIDSQDGAESTRVRKSSLAPVAERRSEYGMDGFLAKGSTDQPPPSHEPAMSSPQLAIFQGEPNDEAKADLMKSRRFSTSPQLPTLGRMSGFGDDLFSSSGNSPWASPNLSASSKEPQPLSSELKGTAAPTDSAPRQLPQYAEEASPRLDSVTTADGNPKIEKARFIDTTELPSSSIRPQLPGGWVSETPSVPISSEQATPLEKREAHGSTLLSNVENINVSPTTGDDAKLDDMPATVIGKSLPLSINTSESAPNTNLTNGSSAQEFGRGAEQHHITKASEASATGLQDRISQSLPPLETENSVVQQTSRPTSILPPNSGSKSPEIQTPSATQPTATVSPTAPLNPNRTQTGQPDIILPSSSQRQSTISTIETASPEKESDKLREEIIKSLSPTPISPGSRGDNDIEPVAGELTRESRYLSGVYDDYLSLAEEKSLQELSQAAKTSTHMTPSQSGEAETEPARELQDAIVPQPAPLSSVKSFVPENTAIPRRFSWQQDEEEALSPVQSKPTVRMLTQESLAHSQGDTNVESSANTDVVSPVTDSLQTENGATGTISHQVSQVSSLTPETSLAANEAPSPVSFAAARRPNPISDVPSTVRLSLADEKEKVLIGDAQSTTSSASEQHPALMNAPEPADHGASPVVVLPDVSPAQPSAAPMPFREILNLTSYEERVRKFDETREQFYIMDSGLSSWLMHLQSQADNSDFMAAGTPRPLVFKPGVQPASTGASSAAQGPQKSGPAPSHTRRMSIGGVQQLMAGQASNQVGTKSKELLHAAGAFGNKGMKSGMKLFNKGKNKLRERAAGDKTFF